MGAQGELCTTTVLNEAWVSYVRNSECSFDEVCLVAVPWVLDLSVV